MKIRSGLLLGFIVFIAGYVTSFVQNSQLVHIEKQTYIYLYIVEILNLQTLIQYNVN
jgi:hypothetical protein